MALSNTNYKQFDIYISKTFIKYDEYGNVLSRDCYYDKEYKYAERTQSYIIKQQPNHNNNHNNNNSHTSYNIHNNSSSSSSSSSSYNYNSNTINSSPYISPKTSEPTSPISPISPTEPTSPSVIIDMSNIRLFNN